MKEDTGFIGFKNMEQIAQHPLEEDLGRPASAEGRLPGQSIDCFDHGGK
ncbi:hypothetical protein ACNKHX_13455 [Shigella flexneri]